MSTTTSPVPVTSPPRGGEDPSGHEPPSGSRSFRRTATRWLGDAIAILVLGWMLCWLPGHDGGRNLAEFIPSVWVAAAFLPWVTSELRRLPRVAAALIAALMLGLLASIAFGTVRSGFEEPSITFAVTVLVGLAAHRVWRREWGPPAVFILLVVGFGLYWQRSFLQWWGAAGGSDVQWRALSWHNQSGTLMAAFGCVFLGVALVANRLLVPAGILLAAGGFAGTWLSGSRGALAAALVALAVTITTGVRERKLGRTSVVAGATLLLSLAVVGWLTFVRMDVAPERSDPLATAVDEARAGQPVFERDEDAGTNAVRRLQHIQAALGMFMDRPLTGHGLGSYGSLAIGWSSPEANLPTHAHNRYAQTLAEGGLLAGAPLLALLAGLGVLTTRRMRTRTRRPSEVGYAPLTDGWRPAISAGLAGAAVMIASHSMIDFDWTYPVLPMMLGIAAGTLAVDHSQSAHPAPSRIPPVVAATVVALLLGGGTAAHVLAVTGPIDRESPPQELASDFRPWQAHRGATIALILSERGAHRRSAAIVDAVRRWSPGLSSIHTAQLAIAYRAGEAPAGELAETLEVGEDWFGSFNLAASVLIEGGDHDVARDILRQAIGAYPVYDQWDRGANEAESYHLLVSSLAETDECGRAETVVEGAPRLEFVDLSQSLLRACGPTPP